MNHKAPFQELHEIKIKCVLQNVWLHLSVSNCRFSVTKTMLIRPRPENRCIKQLKNLNDESLQADATLHVFACRFLMHFSVQDLICWLDSLLFSPLHQHLVTSCLSMLLRSLRGRLSPSFSVLRCKSIATSFPCHASIRVFLRPATTKCLHHLHPPSFVSPLYLRHCLWARDFFCQQVTSGDEKKLGVKAMRTIDVIYRVNSIRAFGVSEKKKFSSSHRMHRFAGTQRKEN